VGWSAMEISSLAGTALGPAFFPFQDSNGIRARLRAPAFECECWRTGEKGSRLFECNACRWHACCPFSPARNSAFPACDDSYSKSTRSRAFWKDIWSFDHFRFGSILLQKSAVTDGCRSVSDRLWSAGP